MRVSHRHAIAHASALTFAAVVGLGGSSAAAFALGGCAFDPSGIEDSTGDDAPAGTDAATGPGVADGALADAVAAPPADAGTDASACRPGWSEHGTSCYFVSPGALGWDDARAFCADLDAHLVIVEDDAENEALRQLSPDDSTWWLGASDAGSEGTWTWVDGTSATFMPWGFLQPDNFFGEDCLLQQANGSWNDAECADAFVFVCEHPIL